MEFEFGIIGDELYLSDDYSLPSDLPMRAVEIEFQRQCDVGACQSELASQFQLFLNELASELQPREVDFLARKEILNNLLSAITNVDNLRGTTLSPFGSFASNLYTRWADLDLSLVLPKNADSKLISKKEKINVLLSFSRNVLYRGPCRNVRLVPSARVPLVSFEDLQHNVSCDVSVENHSAVLKSQLLRSISEIDSRCRDLIFLVKFWAKAHHINDPKTGTLNSFALCLLVIFHLQTRSPPILPPLNAFLDEDITRKLSDGPWNSAEELLIDYRRKIQPFIIQKFGAQNKSSILELFASFCNQFSAVTEFWRQGLAVCTFTGKWGDRASTCAKWRSHQYEMTVEDPFDRAENCARSVHSSTSQLIFKAFESSVDMLCKQRSDCDIPKLLEGIFLWPVETQAMGLQGWLVQVHSKVTTVYKRGGSPLPLKSTSRYSKSGKKHSESVRIGRTKKVVTSVKNSTEEEFRCVQLDDEQAKTESEKKLWRARKKVVSLTSKNSTSAEVTSVMENLIEENFSESLQLDKNREDKVKQRKSRRRKKTVAPLANEEGTSAEINSGVPVAIKSGVIEMSGFPPLISPLNLGSTGPYSESVALKGKRYTSQMQPHGPGDNKTENSIPETSKGQPRLATHTEGSYLAKTLSALDGKAKQGGGNKGKKEAIVKSVSSANTRANEEGQGIVHVQKQDIVNHSRKNRHWRMKDRSSEKEHTKDIRGTGVWHQREELPKVNRNVPQLPKANQEGVVREGLVVAPLPKRPPAERW